RVSRRLALGAAAVGLVASLAGPTAYTLSTVQSGHTGSIVTAGPAGASMMGGGGGGMRGGFGGGGMPGQQSQQGRQGQQNGNGFPGGGMPGQNQQNGNGGTQNQQNGNGFPGGGRMGDGGGMGGGGGVGGLLNGASVSSQAKKLLETDSSKYTWVAAAIGAQNAASYQLSTGEPVMAIGGFNGTDPSPTLAQFKTYVADGKIHYFISSGTGGGMGGSSSGTSSQITSWVEKTFKKVTVGSATFYDLTQKASG
ncbi:glycosyl transferase, partial [Streptomyces panaciradicis]|nr:glycosyl transferase [Streptomyces panaciradicis]